MRRSRTKRRRRDQCGFTLIEVMIAAGILAVGFTALIGLQAMLFQSPRQSHDMQAAALMVQHRAEELSSMNIEMARTVCRGAAPGCAASGAFTVLPASGCSQQVIAPVNLDQPSSADVNEQVYRIDTGINAHPDGVNHPNALIATISVCWRNHAGRVFQITSARVLGER